MSKNTNIKTQNIGDKNGSQIRNTYRDRQHSNANIRSKRTHRSSREESQKYEYESHELDIREVKKNDRPRPKKNNRC